jgi:hypothetical protein
MSVVRVGALALFTTAALIACSSEGDDPGAATAATLAPVTSAAATLAAVTSAASQPEQVARDFIAALNSADTNALVSLFSLPAQIRFSAQQPYVTAQDDSQLRSVLAGVPPCTHQIDSVSTTGDDVVVAATVSGDSCPFAGTGVAITLRVQDGHIVRLG